MTPVTVPPDAEIPSWGRRVAVGILRLIPLLVAYVVVPVTGISKLQGLGVGTGIPLVWVTVGGSIVAVLSTARYIAKPTRAFGPLSMIASGAGVVYLLTFAPYASATIAASQFGLTITYGMLLQLAAIVPAFGLVAGAVTTVEDLLKPGERLSFDFPRRSA